MICFHLFKDISPGFLFFPEMGHQPITTHLWLICLFPLASEVLSAISFSSLCLGEGLFYLATAWLPRFRDSGNLEKRSPLTLSLSCSQPPPLSAFLLYVVSFLFVYRLMYTAAISTKAPTPFSTASNLVSNSVTEHPIITTLF